MSAGKLDRRVTLHSPTTTADNHGGVMSGWTAGPTVWAGFLFLRGGETVIASRLAGRQPAVITIRKSAATALVTTEWKVVHAGTDYNIRAIVPSDDGAFYELTCESGVAQ
jgi:SPP1 family predicted phage head-tail adaptor